MHHVVTICPECERGTEQLGGDESIRYRLCSECDRRLAMELAGSTK